MSPLLVPIAFFVSVALAVVGVAMARAIARRQRDPLPSDEVLARLERMEQAIDAIAIEVERVAEAQRFTTRLLSERAAGPGTPALSQPRR